VQGTGDPVSILFHLYVQRGNTLAAYPLEGRVAGTGSRILRCRLGSVFGSHHYGFSLLSIGRI
jgi:hypothetical protein